MKRNANIERYIEEITGVRTAVRAARPDEIQAVPLFLRTAYSFSIVPLFSRLVVLAADEAPGATTPGEYVRQMELLRSTLDADVVLTLPHMTTRDRNRLIRKRVPFLVPGSQMFLPFLAVDLRERAERRPPARREVLASASQALVLYHLLVESVERRALSELASTLGYSAMTLTNVAGELHSVELCEVLAAGRSRHIVMVASGRALWERALPFLSSPVRTRQWVRLQSSDRAISLWAGLTALSRYTELAADPTPTVAIHQRQLRHLRENGVVVLCDGPDEAELQLETWSYAPELLSDESRVDRLSLYLSLRDHGDERVERALVTLLEDVAW